MKHAPSLRVAVAATVLVCLSRLAAAAGPPDSAALLAAQRQALQPLSILDGTWRGPARITAGDGKVIEITQTERVGSLLGGTLKVIEGRGYAADGSLPFNAFAVVSYSPQARTFNFHSYAQGYAGDFALEVRADGFAWTIPAGPGVTLRYTATIKDGVWDEIGERIVEGQPAVRTLEMTLRRVGDTGWPEAGAVQPK